MKRSLPSSPNTIPDQQRIEERGPGGAIITTAVPFSPPAPAPQHADLYRSTSASSMNSYYSTSSTNTAFGSSFNGHGGSGGAGGAGGIGGTTRSSRQQQSEQSSASLSSLDCFNTIGSSLKRVKISTSPGELRLNKDIEAMAHGHGHGRGHAHGHGVRQRPQRSAELEWISVDESGGGAACGVSGNSISISSSNSNSNSNNIASNGGLHYHRTLQSTDGTVIVRRDVVDPLRLRILVTFRTERPWEMRGWGVMAHSSARESYETWTYLVQIPRMYPHSPPLVQRITREGGSMPSNITELVQQQRQQEQEQRMRLQQHQHQQHQLSHQYSSESTAERRNLSNWATIPSAARHGGPNGPPMVERIIVSSNPSIHPPSAEEGEMTGICIDSDPTAAGGSDPLTGTMATFGGWSPISRLSDLVSFLAELPVKRLEAWAARGGTGGGAEERANNNGSISSSTSDTTSGENVLREQRYGERQLGENGSRRGVVRRHLSSDQYMYAYNQDDDATMENGNGQTVTDRPSHQRRRTSQESDVDVSAIRLAGSSTHSGSERDVSMEGGQVTCSMSAPPLPANLEESFHPNRFDKGFDRNSAAAASITSTTSLWRSTSALDVVASPSADGTAGSVNKEEHWQQKSSSESICLDGSRPPMQTTLGLGWGVDTGTSTPSAPLKEHQSDFDTTSFRQSNMDAHMMDD
mmetsp:Transcript_34753/g.76322  ORF Transcript_34753/g.76322 Transcript_34753/m.76322 type:complete len:693 (-) Transcript_34753:57-2135(-)